MFSTIRAAAVAVVAIAAGSASAQTTGTYTVSQVTAFQQTVGNFGASNLQRVSRMVVTVGANRNMAITLPDTWYGTLTGKMVPIANNPGYYSFTASKTLNTGVGINVVKVQAVVQTNASGLPIRLAMVSRTGNSVAAVVNGTGFGSGVSSVYNATVNLRRR